MDTIILAAGENTRLQVGGLPPGKKPLLFRDGEVLIRRLARQAMEAAWGRVVIVCSPNNVEDIVFATKDFDPLYIVQPTASGPTNAVDLGLRLVQTKLVLLLMADNFIPELDNLHMVNEPMVWVTRKWDTALHPIVTGRFCKTAMCNVRWLGPLILDTEKWVPGMGEWVGAFIHHTFQTVVADGIEDMGVIQ